MLRTLLTNYRLKISKCRPGATGSEAGYEFTANIGKLLAADGRFEPVYVNVPANYLIDIAISAEYVAYSLHYISELTNQTTALLTWSQGSIAAQVSVSDFLCDWPLLIIKQWAFKYWPSTQKTVTDSINLSGDYHGTLVAYLLCNGVVNPLGTYASFIHSQQSPAYLTTHSLTHETKQYATPPSSNKHTSQTSPTNSARTTATQPTSPQQPSTPHSTRSSNRKKEPQHPATSSTPETSVHQTTTFKKSVPEKSLRAYTTTKASSIMRRLGQSCLMLWRMTDLLILSALGKLLVRTLWRWDFLWRMFLKLRYVSLCDLKKKKLWRSLFCWLGITGCYPIVVVEFCRIPK